MKKCSKCNFEKELTEYYRKKGAKDGYQPHCKACDNTRNKMRMKTDRYRQARASYMEKYQEIHKEEIKKWFRSYYQARKDKYADRNRVWIKENKERWREIQREYFQTSKRKGKHRVNQARRRAIKLRATLSGFDAQIAEIYSKCPEGYHVDHIVPIRGKEVCGLHVPWNLQYLPALENIKKGNR